MEWVILFLASWLLFFLLVDWKTFRVSIWCGVAAMAVHLLLDTRFIHQEFYRIQDPVLSFLGSSLFFTTGPVFVIGFLLTQFHPKKRIQTTIHVLVITAFYSLQELLLISRGKIIYLHWDFVDSLFVNVVAMILLSWFSQVILNKGKEVCK